MNKLEWEALLCRLDRMKENITNLDDLFKELSELRDDIFSCKNE